MTPQLHTIRTARASEAARSGQLSLKAGETGRIYAGVVPHSLPVTLRAPGRYVRPRCFFSLSMEART